MGVGEEERPSPLIPVVIGSDGSAVVDGEPVPVVGGESVDVAILDTLHGYARNRNTPVTASIADPESGSVAIVEVAPDGSSRLVEQHAGAADLAGYAGDDIQATAVMPTVPADPADPAGLTEPADPAEPADPFDKGALPDPSASTDPSAPTGRSGPVGSVGAVEGPAMREPRGVARGVGQSDDEYEGPGLLRRPAVIGAVAVVVALMVFVPLVVLGSRGDGKDQAAGTVRVTDPATPDTTPSPSVSASPSASSSASPSSSPSGSGSASPSASPSRSVAPVAPRPVNPPDDDSDIPTGKVVLKNKKWSLCLDLPGTAEGKKDQKVQDGACVTSSADNQRWTLDKSSSGKGTRGADLYLIRNVKDGLCLDLPYYEGKPSGTAVSEFTCDGTDHDNQLWWFDKRANGTYWIRNQKSGDLCLDVARADKKAAHAGMTIYGCSDLDDHQWSFVKV